MKKNNIIRSVFLTAIPAAIMLTVNVNAVTLPLISDVEDENTTVSAPSSSRPDSNIAPNTPRIPDTISDTPTTPDPVVVADTPVMPVKPVVTYPTTVSTDSGYSYTGYTDTESYPVTYITDPAPVTPITPDPVPVYPTESAAADVNYSAQPAGITAGSGEYVVTYTPESASYPAASVTEKKVKLGITARTDSGGNVILEWDKVKKADKYTVYCLSGKKWSAVGETDKTSYTYRGMQSGKTYRFMVRYTIGGQTSGVDESFKISVRMQKNAVKPNVTASAKDGKVTLKWTAVPGASKYAVYRVEKGAMKKVTTTAGTSAVIKQKPSDDGYAVKAYISGKWTTVDKSDIVLAN